jgi:hypothetical protein
MLPALAFNCLMIESPASPPGVQVVPRLVERLIQSQLSRAVINMNDVIRYFATGWLSNLIAIFISGQFALADAK